MNEYVFFLCIQQIEGEIIIVTKHCFECLAEKFEDKHVDVEKISEFLVNADFIHSL